MREAGSQGQLRSSQGPVEEVHPVDGLAVALHTGRRFQKLKFVLQVNAQSFSETARPSRKYDAQRKGNCGELVAAACAEPTTIAKTTKRTRAARAVSGLSNVPKSFSVSMNISFSYLRLKVKMLTILSRFFCCHKWTDNHFHVPILFHTAAPSVFLKKFIGG